MLALLAAAALTAQPAPDIKVHAGTRAEAMAQAQMLCRPRGMVQTSADPALLWRDDGKSRVRLLAELPKANHEKAVAREVAGCANPLVVQYGAGR